MPRKPADKASRGGTKRPAAKRRVTRAPSSTHAAAENPDTAFIDALSEDFKRHGASAIAEVRQADPVTYMKLCASVLPKSVMGAIDPLDSLSDEELQQRPR